MSVPAVTIRLMDDPILLISEHLFDSVAPPFVPTERKDLVLTEQIRTPLDPHVPLSEVTFCVVDLETTGGSPVDSRITEIGAVKVRGGERIGTFQTLVDPREPIPAYVAGLTGIDDRLVAGEPPIEQVVPALVEFLRGSVFVAHNAGFDFGFVNAALARLDYAPVPGPPVCTAKLARRVVWSDVPNVKLATLARYFRTRVQPVHRALADAEATAEVLHGLIDLGGRLGIRTLGDLPIRRCTAAMGARTRFAPSVLADIGRCSAPCDGRVDPERCGELVRHLLSSLQRPGGLLEALEARMATLARVEQVDVPPMEQVDGGREIAQVLDSMHRAGTRTR